MRMGVYGCVTDAYEYMRMHIAAMDDMTVPLKSNRLQICICMYIYISLVEERITTGSWELATELEAVGRRSLGLTGDAERHRAASLQLRRARLESSLANIQGRGR